MRSPNIPQRPSGCDLNTAISKSQAMTPFLEKRLNTYYKDDSETGPYHQWLLFAGDTLRLVNVSHLSHHLHSPTQDHQYAVAETN